MAFDLTYRAYKGLTTAAFRQAFEQIVADRGGAVDWGSPDGRPSKFSTCHSGNVHVIAAGHEVDLTARTYASLDYLLCTLLGQTLNCPYLELRIQQASIWDCSLYVGAAWLENFSAYPRFWPEEMHAPAGCGRMAVQLAAVWEVPIHQIERYFVSWPEGILEADEASIKDCKFGKAYEQDQHGYGDYMQMLDVLHAVGGEDPWSIEGIPRGGVNHGLQYPRADALLRDVKWTGR